jgi:endonuclease/exonuclease/phosphatase family metal-dependent hydrolase
VRTTSEGDAGCVREEEVDKLKDFAAEFAAPRIYGGDFNMQPAAGEAEYQLMLQAPLPATDSWKRAVDDGTAVAFNGDPNNNTPTRNTRLDYVFFDHGAPQLTVDGAEILDEGSLSDHRMMITVFMVR